VLADNQVAIFRGQAQYPHQAPFHPVERYPEYPFGNNLSRSANLAYEAVRNSLRLLDLDKANFGRSSWNPLGELIFPGAHVVLKPNLIQESHRERKNEWEQVITHPSIIRAVLDYVVIALKGKGKITIADGPDTEVDFDEIIQRTGLDKIADYFREKGLEVSLLDLRRDHWLQKNGVTYKRETLAGDPDGYTTINLDNGSEFSNYPLSGRFYGADYDVEETAKYHENGHHAYVLCRSVMNADVLINLPKMKTHKKTGITLSLKNMVGVNGYRNCLPHYSIGTPENGGDEYSVSNFKNTVQSWGIVKVKNLLTVRQGIGGPFVRLAFRIGKLIFGRTERVIRSGNWYGNDTTWRMVLDLNKCLFHFSSEGKSRTRPLKYMTLIDGIIAGDGNGPLSPDSKPCGVVVAGFNSVVVDTVCTTLMGFNYRKLSMLREAWKIKEHPLVNDSPADIVCKSNVQKWDGPFAQLELEEHLGFRPHFGWKGHIERKSKIKTTIS
jgi:uncharacterized protein (DUF362 family)